LNPVFFVHLAACFFMTGAIWLVQVLIYPNFLKVTPSQFQAFHRFHSNRISWVVGPFMAVELATAVVLYWQSPTLVFAANFVSVLILWLLTVLVSVPIHNKLQAGFDVNLIQQLIKTNWPRTVIWSIRSLALYPLSGGFL
jgi:hypothetical protein